MLLTLVTTHRQMGLRGFAASYEGIIILIMFYIDKTGIQYTYKTKTMSVNN